MSSKSSERIFSFEEEDFGPFETFDASFYFIAIFGGEGVEGKFVFVRHLNDSGGRKGSLCRVDSSGEVSW